MPFQLSPGVQVVEKDFSSIVPAVSSSTGAFAGPFAWGPVEDPIRISSENELVTRFGLPEDGNYGSFFTAANFLSYTNSLFVSRSDAVTLKNAVATASGGVTSVTVTSIGGGYTSAPTITFSAPQLAGGVTATGTVTVTISGGFVATMTVNITNPGSGYTTAPTVTFSAALSNDPADAATATAAITTGGVKIKNVSQFLANYQSDTGIYGPVVAKFPGTRANGLEVKFLDAGNWASTPSNLKALFTGAPGTSDFAAQKGITNDELHIVVLDNATGSFSGTPNSVLEKYSFVSKLKDAKRTDGANNFWKSVVNGQSKYLWSLGVAPNTALSASPVTTVVTGEALVFAATSKTITVAVNTGSVAHTSLTDFKTFINAAVDGLSSGATDTLKSQINVTDTTNNNGYFTVASITSTVSGSDEIFVITVLENLVNETASSDGSIIAITKSDWNVNSSAFTGSVTAKTFKVLKAAYNLTLSGGVTDLNSTDGQIQTAYGLFANTDEYDISLIPTGRVSPAVAAWVVDNIAEVRRDCVVFISPNDHSNGLTEITGTGSDATDKIIAYRNALDVSSSYAVMDSGFKYQYDRYNDVYRWIPLNGDIAGLCARTDFTSDPWFSPGGYTRGQIKNIVKLAFNPSPTDRDVLYPAGVNPVVTFPGQGTVLFGDKTLLAKPSAFDRINVRRLFIVLEKSIATAAKFQLFEFNDSFTRAQFRNLVEPFLRDVQGRRGIIDFRVKCDESNNSGEVIDRNEFVADIFIKPNRSINFITLNFVAARSSVSFEEIGA